MSLCDVVMQHEGLTILLNIFLCEHTVENHNFPTIFEEGKLMLFHFDIAQNGNCSKERRRQWDHGNAATATFCHGKRHLSVFNDYCGFFTEVEDAFQHEKRNDTWDQKISEVNTKKKKYIR
jgi:hypothetical protein